MRVNEDLHNEERLVGISGQDLDCIYEDLLEADIKCELTTQMILVKKKDSEAALRVLQNYRVKTKMRINIYRDSVNNIRHLVEETKISTKDLASLLGTTPRRTRRLISGDTKCTLEDMEDFAAIFGVDPGKLTYLTYKQFLNYLEEVKWEPASCISVKNLSQ